MTEYIEAFSWPSNIETFVRIDCYRASPSQRLRWAEFVRRHPG